MARKPKDDGVGRHRGPSPAELSAARALVARDLIAGTGIAPERFARVTGEADRKPIWNEPTDLRNRRTEIILLRSDLSQ